MMDDRLDEQLKDLAAEYNRPPETPREEMWAAIQKNRAAYRAPRRITGLSAACAIPANSRTQPAINPRVELNRFINIPSQEP